MIYILIVLCLILIVIYLIVKNKIRDFSRQTFQTDSLLEGFQKQEEQFQNTPKSISAMTKIILPKINKDFPEFDWNDWKQRCQIALISYLETLESKDITRLKYCSDDFKSHVQFILRDNLDNHINEKYDSILIHRLEIVDYRKQKGFCQIIIEASLQYEYSRNQNLKRKQQEKYRLELVYIQDASLTNHASSSLVLTCPHCGGPVVCLGQKRCEYCDSVLIPINIKVWSLNTICKK